MGSTDIVEGVARHETETVGSPVKDLNVPYGPDHRPRALRFCPSDSMGQQKGSERAVTMSEISLSEYNAHVKADGREFWIR